MAWWRLAELKKANLVADAMGIGSLREVSSSSSLLPSNALVAQATDEVVRIRCP